MSKNTVVNERIIIYDGFLHRITGLAMTTAKSRNWQSKVKGILKGELKRRDLTYADLADRLQAIGIKDSERNISNKISRGTFTAIFFVQCLTAIGCKTIQLGDE